MPTVAISVDCEAANIGRCYAREMVRVAEEFTVPLTWLICVSEKDPLSNLDLYHREYFHTIPAWHETGLLVGFENSSGYISDPKERGDLIRIGKDVMKSRHVKPTSFRARHFDLLPSDLRNLEDIGIVVDASACPGAADKHEVVRPAGPTQPYHPSYDNVSAEGDARILMAPVATHRGVAAYLDAGWSKVEAVLAHSVLNNHVTVIGVTDHVNNVETLRKAISFCKEKGSTFVTLTSIAALS